MVVRFGRIPPVAHARAGQPALPEDLVDLTALEDAYYSTVPDPDDPVQQVVFGTSGLGTFSFKLLIIAILTSSAASCQTTILPAARTALSVRTWRRWA